jgi:hypothetical protein
MISAAGILIKMRTHCNFTVSQPDLDKCFEISNPIQKLINHNLKGLLKGFYLT